MQVQRACRAAISRKRGAKTASRDFNAGFCPQPAKLSTGIESHVVKENISRKAAKAQRKTLRNAVALCVFSSFRLCAFAALREICCCTGDLQLDVKSAM